MLLHIGNGKTVRGEEIVGIFDLDNATVSHESRAYLSAATRAGEVTYADSDIPRAFLVTAAPKTKKTHVGEPLEAPAGEKSPRPAGNGGRPRHPIRKKREKHPIPAQKILLSHVSSAALHSRCDRPIDMSEE